MQIIHKEVKDLNAVEFRACLKANYGAVEGYMHNALEAAKTNHTGHVIMLWDGPPDKIASLRGWALLTPCTTSGELAVSRWVMMKSTYSAQFWIKKRWRGKGWGKVLMTEVKKHDKNPHVIPHDRTSSEFFSSYNVQVMRLDSYWMKRGKPKVA